MDIQERRALLVCERNPDIKLDYVISITGHMASHAEVDSSVIRALSGRPGHHALGNTGRIGGGGS